MSFLFSAKTLPYLDERKFVVRYALRKQTVEPVFGIIKSVMGFRQFSLRGLKKVSGEWTLVCLAWNVKRMAVLRPNCAGSG